MVPSYDSVNLLFACYLTASVAMTVTFNPSYIIYITAVEAYYEVTISLISHVMNFKIF